LFRRDTSVGEGRKLIVTSDRPAFRSRTSEAYRWSESHHLLDWALLVS
jgi:hypothetical protein